MNDSFNSIKIPDGTTEIIDGNNVTVYFKHNIKTSDTTYIINQSYNIDIDLLKTLLIFVNIHKMKTLNFKTKELSDILDLPEEERADAIDALKPA